MGKHEAGTPKYIANKIKAKGLQKLRWYCQMCQKQCRDENGFKCHMMSESHQRQLLLFADNSRRFMDQFSHEFEKGYLELLKRQFGTKRVPANKIYQEYIMDRNHLHMNATKWLTLTEFVKHLGREGKCVVDETEKGWFVQYIDRDPQTIALQEAQAKKVKMDKDDEEKRLSFIQKQIIRGKKSVNLQEPQYTELNREDEEEKISLKLSKKEEAITSLGINPFIFKKPEIKKTTKPEKRKLNSLDEIKELEELQKEKKNRKDYWLTENIVVKVVTKSLGEKYFKKKGVVQSLINKYCAMVLMFDTEDLLKLDQAHLETVIPSVGRTVKVVNGAYRSHTATLKSINEKKFSVSIEINTGPLKGRILDDVQYEDISKVKS